MIKQRIEQLRQEIPTSVRLIAVSKTVSVEAMREAYKAGMRDFGESKLQEALSKQEKLTDLKDISWHFIGHLQGNKAKKVLEHFNWIHTVDNLKLAQRLNRLAQELDLSPNVCLQVKLLDDPNKYGWSALQLKQDLLQLDQCDRLKIQGLMTILPLGLSDSETLEAFKAVNKLKEEIKAQNYSKIRMQELSMGMSGDYKTAIAAGATMVRLGQIIFGSRT